MSRTMSSASQGIDQAILLHPDDNVLVCVAPILPGDQLWLDGEAVVASEAIDVGHKLARAPLSAGARIIKYGAPVGSLTRSVARAGHVHLHNMQSDYIPSHTRTRQNATRSES